MDKETSEAVNDHKMVFAYILQNGQLPTCQGQQLCS